MLPCYMNRKIWAVSMTDCLVANWSHTSKYIYTLPWRHMEGTSSLHDLQNRSEAYRHDTWPKGWTEGMSHWHITWRADWRHISMTRGPGNKWEAYLNDMWTTQQTESMFSQHHLDDKTGGTSLQTNLLDKLKRYLHNKWPSGQTGDRSSWQTTKRIDRRHVFTLPRRQTRGISSWHP